MSKTSAPATREQRLAAKLKENLRRRKAQARARATGGDEKTPASNDSGKTDKRDAK